MLEYNRNQQQGNKFALYIAVAISAGMILMAIFMF